jgi:hypothetical protein
MHVQSFGSSATLHYPVTLKSTEVRVSTHGAVSSVPTTQAPMTLEEAFAEWAEESLTMANEMWHHGATDTRDV